jgi:hypothetical protein
LQADHQHTSDGCSTGSVATADACWHQECIERGGCFYKWFC